MIDLTLIRVLYITGDDKTIQSITYNLVTVNLEILLKP